MGPSRRRHLGLSPQAKVCRPLRGSGGSGFPSTNLGRGAPANEFNVLAPSPPSTAWAAPEERVRVRGSLQGPRPPRLAAIPPHPSPLPPDSGGEGTGKGSSWKLLIALLIFLTACGSPEPTPSVPPPTSPPDAATATDSAPQLPIAPPPIVLISIDTLRSDRLPAYGYKAGHTPHLDRLAQDGIVFERAYAHTPLTLPSHVSLFSGRLPHRHGVRDNRGYPVALDTLPWLPLELARQGYRSAAAVSAFVLHRSGGFHGEDDGFEIYDDRIDDRSGVALGGIDRSGAETLSAVTPWLEERLAAWSESGEPFFLFLHLFEPHSPYSPPEPFASQLTDPYDGEIAEADRVVGLLLEQFENAGHYDDSLIVVLSDHGEGLGDHGEEEHGLFLYREAIQVPLILKLPAGLRAGERRTEVAQLVDVLPTLLDASGVPAGDRPADLDGRSLLGPRDAARPHLAETFYPRLHFGWSELTSVIVEADHLIEGPDPELYDLVEDPGETENRLPGAGGRAETLRALLPPPEDFEPPSPIDAATRERLAALGYLSGGSGEAGGLLADPKAQLGSLEALRQGRRHLEAGDPEAAVAAYRRALRDSPGMLDGWQALGDLLRQLGRNDDALGAYRRAYDLSGGHPERRAILVRLELEGVLAALEAGDWRTAEETATRVVELDPEQVEGWNDLGVARWQLGQQEEALKAWQRAVALDPEAWDTLFNLGTKAAELDRPDLARPALERFAREAPEDAYPRERLQARVLLRRLGP